MKEIVKILNKGIQDDGCYTSQEFKSFARKFKNCFGKEIAKVGGTKHEQDTGHYYLSGFFTVAEQPYYYSISVARGGYGRSTNNLLIRTAQHYKDYTGGSNHYLPLGEDMLVDNLPRF